MGYFGSGKSHFLKILSYLLDTNKTINGKRAIDYIEDRILDPILVALKKMKEINLLQAGNKRHLESEKDVEEYINDLRLL